MPRIIQYILLLLMVTALQVLLFDNLQWGLYIHPFIYLAFVLLLPMEIGGGWLLLLAAAVGVAMDFFSGAPGVNTIAATAAAFCRPSILRWFVGKDLVGDGGVPNARRIGRGKFSRYALLLIAVHCTVFYTMETLSTVGVWFTLLRIVASVLCTFIVIWLIQSIFGTRKAGR
jgi:hypothetical protein